MVSSRDIRAMRRQIKKLDRENANLITFKKRLERQLDTQNLYIELFMDSDTDNDSEIVESPCPRPRPRLWH